MTESRQWCLLTVRLALPPNAQIDNWSVEMRDFAKALAPLFPDDTWLDQVLLEGLPEQEPRLVD